MKKEKKLVDALFTNSSKEEKIKMCEAIKCYRKKHSFPLVFDMIGVAIIILIVGEFIIKIIPLIK